MTKQFASMFVLLAFALTPAHAKDKHKDEWQRLTDKRENAEDRIGDLQQRLQSDELSDRQRDKIEDRIQDIADKFGVVLPPPPDPEPEPTELFKDDFNRDQTEVGNGWIGHDASLDAEHMRITPDGEIYRAVPLDEPFKTVTVSFDASGVGNVQMFWTEGDPSGNTVPRQYAIATELAEFSRNYNWTTAERIDEAGEPVPYTSFGFGFSTSGIAAVDNVVVNGVPFPASTFVGF